MQRTRALALSLIALLLGGCGGRGGMPPEIPPLVKGPDGREYHLLERGAYKGFYDRWGRLQRIEYDSNGDHKPDVIAHHDGAKTPHLLEVDEDFDGVTDRWEDYDPAGILVKVGVSRRQTNMPDLWVSLSAAGQPIRKEYDQNADARVDRTERLRNGLVVSVELDTDNDSRVDRWQDWGPGRLASESLDIDRDGKPDRRIVYSEKGSVLRLESVVP